MCYYPTVNIPPSGPPNHSRNVLVGAGLLVAITLLLIALNTEGPRPVTNTQVMDSPPVRFAATPTSYTSYLGTIKAIDGSLLTITHTIIATDGKRVDREQRVTVDQATILDRRSMDTGQTVGPLVLSDLQVGQKLRVASATDVGTVDAFTASSLSLLITSPTTP